MFIYFLQDECSYVSLRDVERAMIVFEYFYEKSEIFKSSIEKYIEKNYNNEKVS